MKKLRSNFVVEYKGARRKLQSKPKSIWGEVDLRSYADGDDTAGPMNGASNRQDPSTAYGLQDDEVSVRDSAGEKAAIETSVAHELRQDLNLEVAVAMAVEPARKAQSNKLRSGRAVHSAESAVDRFIPPTGEPKKRGSKRAVKSADGDTDIAPVQAKASTRKAAKTKLNHLGTQAGSGDELDDLSQLELENARLRKLLAEKLRSENAFLRQRLRRAYFAIGVSASLPEPRV